MEKAIELANKEGGYSWHIAHWQEAMLDPLFFQSLGKALGSYPGEWKQKAMSFFDETVCEGKDANLFFEELLK